MKVILLESIHNLGSLGDVVEVKPGYGRNFLVPKGKAQLATKENVQRVEEHRAELAKAAQDALSYAQAIAQKISGTRLTILRKEVAEGRIFGSVSAQDIVKELQALDFPVERRQIRLNDGVLRSLGEHKVAISLHADVETEITVVVAPEE